MKLLILIIIIFLLIRILIYLLIKKRKEKLRIGLNSNFFIEELNRIIEENKYNLVEERRRLMQIDPYGNEDLKKWIGNPLIDEKEIRINLLKGSNNFKEGIPYFWIKVIIKNFENIDLFFEKWNCYRIINPNIKDETLGINRKLTKNDWYIFIASMIEKTCLNIINNAKLESNNNYKKGIKFEDYCFKRLISTGWKVEETPNTGDQGVDLIASLDDLRVCLQCKDHEKPVGNKAVQEIYAGKKYWSGTHAILVSKSGFTKSAYKLAKTNKVILINEIELDNLCNMIF